MKDILRTEEEKVKIVDEYPIKVQEYLENKYDQSFVINPQYKFRPGGPIPSVTLKDISEQPMEIISLVN